VISDKRRGCGVLQLALGFCDWIIFSFALDVGPELLDDSSKEGSARTVAHPLDLQISACRPTRKPWLQRALLHLRFVRYGAFTLADAGRVVVPQRVTSGTSELKPAQRRALLALESERGIFLTRSEYERITGVGRSQAAYDLAELVSAGRLIRVGRGRSTRYLLAHEPASQRRWTPDRIRRELEAFCRGRSAWPTASEFKTAGRGDLYVAASRYGGVAHWAGELGLDRFSRMHAARTARAPLRSRLAWGSAGALGVLASVAVVAVVVTNHFGSSGNTGAAPAKLQPALRIVYVPRRTNATRAAARHTGPPMRTHAARRTAKTGSRAQSTPTQQTSLVSDSLQTVSTHTAPSETLAATASGSGGPAPLPAPTGASAPSALRAP
jgi:hypothetical protein